MKVLFIAGWYPIGNSYEGIFVKEHAIAVSKFNDIAVIYGEKNKHQKKVFEFYQRKEDKLKIIHFTYKRSSFSISSFSTYIKGVLIAYKKLTQQGFNPDIVHAHVHFTGVPAAIIKQRYNIPFVITEHHSKITLHKMKRKDIKRMRYAMNKADYIFPVSYTLKNAIEEYGINNRFEIIPNTVNSDIFYYDPTKRNEKIVKILTVSSMTPIKGINVLIEAANILKKRKKIFILNIVGSGEKTSEYKNLVKKLNLDKHVNFLGRKKKEEIAELMRKSTFFVLPSLWETFSCVIIEALSCGLPVVATRVGGIPEIINNKNGVLVKPSDSEELATAMEWMMDNFDKFSFAEIAKEAHKKYSYDTVGEKITKFYIKVLNGRMSI